MPWPLKRFDCGTNGKWKRSARRCRIKEGAITYRQVTDDNNAARIARRTAAARLDQYLAETTA